MRKNNYRDQLANETLKAWRNPAGQVQLRQDPATSIEMRVQAQIKGESMHRKYIQRALLAVALVTAGAFAPVIPAQGTPQRIEVTAKRFDFEPGEITVKKGQPVVLVLKSADVSHGIRIRELNVDVKAGKGATAEVQFTPNKTGDFVGHCSVFCGSGHGSMVFKVHVVE